MAFGGSFGAGLGGGAGSVGTGYVKIKPDAEGFGDELDGAVGKEASGAGSRIGDKTSKAFRGAFLAGTAMMAKSVFDFAGFDQGMREVFTLMPGISKPAMDEMSGQVKDFAGEFGVLPNEVIPALYSSLSAGVPPGNVFDFLETAQKLAKGGVTDLETAVDGLTSVVNAYGAENIEAANASDVMFTTVKLGKTTIDELSGQLFQVTPLAAAMGVEFEQVGASMAALTSVTGNTAAASTQLKAMLNELGKEGSVAFKAFEAATDQTFPEFIAAGGTLGDGLVAMGQHAEENGTTLNNMFGSVEAGLGALTLAADGAAVFSANLDEMSEAAGATEEAYDMMNQGLSATMEKLKARFAVVMLNLGESLAPFVGAVGNALATVLDLFTKLPGPAQGLIIIFATLTAGIIGFAGPILKAVQVFKMLGGAMSLLAANPFVLVLLGLAAVAFVIYKNWDTVSSALVATWGWMQDVAGALADWFVKTWDSVAGAISGAWDAITGATTTAIDAIGSAVSAGFEAVQKVVELYLGLYLGAFELAWSGITTAVGTAWTAISSVTQAGMELVSGVISTGWAAISTVVDIAAGTVTTIISTAWETVRTVTETAWNGVRTVVETIGSGVVGFVTGIPGTIGSAFSTLASIISTPFTTAFAAIKTAWNSTVGGFGFTAPGWIPGMGGKGFTIPSMATGGIADEPMIALIGDAGAHNPEIVTPVGLMRETVAAAITDSGGSTGHTISLVMNVDASVTDPRFFEEQATEILRVVQRELDRASHGSGSPGSRIVAA